MSVNIEKSRCPQNHPCPAIAVCKFEALAQQGLKAPTVDADKCTDCGQCVRFCPKGALQAAGKSGNVMPCPDNLNRLHLSFHRFGRVPRES